MLLRNSESYVVKDWSSHFNFHNLDAGAYWHKTHGFLHARLLKKVVSYLAAKFNKMAYFGVEFNSVKNILKASPETQYSCSWSMQSKWQLILKKNEARFLSVAKQAFKRNETRLLCLRLESICVINVLTKCLLKSHRKLRDYTEYQRKRMFSILAHDLEGCNLKVFSLEQSWGSLHTNFMPNNEVKEWISSF